MKRCVNCARELEDHIRFCPGCGTAQPAGQPQYTQQPQYAPPQPQYAPPQPQVNVNINSNPFGFSDWDGSVLDTFLNSLVASLMITFTCGIATPWAVCYIMKYVVSHAVINGKRLVFNGTGGALFGKWLGWMLLSVITCGIYSLWVTPKMYKWICSNIQFQN